MIQVKPYNYEDAKINFTLQFWFGVCIHYYYFTSIDAPLIVHVRNFTIYPDSDVEQSAILECAVSNTEKDLDMWVDWTAIDGKKIKREHVTLREGDVFYLLLYNATAADYMCQLFSTYSPKNVEDKQVVAVVFSGQQMFTNLNAYTYIFGYLYMHVFIFVPQNHLLHLLHQLEV